MYERLFKFPLMVLTAFWRSVLDAEFAPSAVNCEFTDDVRLPIAAVVESARAHTASCMETVSVLERLVSASCTTWAREPMLSWVTALYWMSVVLSCGRPF